MGLFLNDIKSHFKLDLFDKIIIATIFLLGAIFSPVFASEIVEINVIDNYSISTNSYKIISVEGASLGYVKLEPGYKYTLTKSSGSSFPYGFSNNIPTIGDTLYNYGVYGSSSGDFTFTYSDYQYLYIDFRTSSVTSITREPLQGMDNFIDNLAYYNGFDNLWNTFISIIPYTTVVVLVCIGLLIIRRSLSSLSKGKSRI